MNLVHLFKRIAAVLALSASVAAPVLAQPSRGPTTPEEQTRIVQLAPRADKDPIGVMTSPDGRWFEKWAEEAPDYMLGPDKAVFWLISSGAAKADLKRVLRFHHTLSIAAFQLQHHILDPEANEADKEAKTLAGLEGVLRAYETLVLARPDNRTPQMDEALAARNRGALAAFVKGLPPMPAR
jgi:carboxypeptidase Q